MKKDYILDYLSCIVFKVLGPVIRSLPLSISLFLGKTIGAILYYFDLRHRALVYSNIKKALGNELSSREISAISKKFYLNLGQNLIEVFLIPVVKKRYFNKYITVEGANNAYAAFGAKKGVILTAVHAGNWELSNIVCANLGFPFSLFVRGQKFARLDELLNSLRQSQGYKVIQRENQLRGLIEALKNNEAVGMTADQGGKLGTRVKFFGQEASMASGAVKLGLKYGAVILPSYYTRINGPYQKVIIGEPFKTDSKASLEENLQRLVYRFEELIRKYPQEYYWLYKIWKYSKEKNILILSDAKPGHLRQAQALANIIRKVCAAGGGRARVDLQEVEFKNNLYRSFLALSGVLAGKFTCQGCLWCLRNFLNKGSYQALISSRPDIIISCGSSLAQVNFVLSQENRAKSVVLMRPSILSVKKFDLVIMPRHDRPPKRKNVLVTAGALNLIGQQYLKEESEKLKELSAFSFQLSANYIGLLIGGDTKNFRLKEDSVREVIGQIKSACEKNNLNILATTSRRTNKEIDSLLKEELKDYPRCKFLVIASEGNPAFAIGGILGLSQIIIISAESISMISEAVKSKKYVVVFDAARVDKKHRDFLKFFAENKYIRLVHPYELSETINSIIVNKPLIPALRDDDLIAEAVKKIL